MTRPYRTFCKSRYDDEDLGISWPCERDKDHDMPHRYSITWNDEPAQSNQEET